jgi:serine/threonine protein kinase
VSRDGPIIGIIEEYIYYTFGTNCPPPQGIDMHNVVHTRKDRWTGQISKCVHQSGVIWGDGKPENVLVDVNDNA